MADDEKRIDLVQRAAERWGSGPRQSLVEKAAARLAEQQAPAKVKPAGEPAQTPHHAEPAPATEQDPARTPADRAKEARGARTSPRTAQRRANIDLVKLRLQDYVTPDPSGTPTRLAEEYRIIKRGLLNRAFGKGVNRIENGHLIMVTSTRPDEGKTFTSINLAMSIASERDLNVLLIDGDVRKRDLLRRLGIEAEKGLIDLLEYPDLDFSEVVIRTNIPNLSLLGAGTYSPHATELLSSARMGEFITDIASRYPDRVIIFDAPPVLASSEPSVLAMYMGQIVMVVEADKTGRRALEEALSLISTCQNISFVLNKISFKAESDRFGAYYYGYSER